MVFRCSYTSDLATDHQAEKGTSEPSNHSGDDEDQDDQNDGATVQRQTYVNAVREIKTFLMISLFPLWELTLKQDSKKF